MKPRSRTSWFWRRIAGRDGRLHLGLAVGAVAIVGLVAAGGLVNTGSASTAANAPRNLARPVVTGLQVGQTLTVTPGTWTGDTPMTFEYQWVRSEGVENWAPIPGAKSSSYKLTSTDIGHSLFVQVKATNDVGHAWGNSMETSYATGPTASDVIELQDGRTSVSVANVAAPNHLVVQSAKFTPASLRTGGTVTVEVLVQDVLGNPVRGSTVDVVGLPFGAIMPVKAVTTDAYGIARITLSASSRLPGMHIGSAALMVRVAKPGDNLLTGVTGRRLVKLPIL